jgi:hypothetical protein
MLLQAVATGMWSIAYNVLSKGYFDVYLPKTLRGVKHVALFIKMVTIKIWHLQNHFTDIRHVSVISVIIKDRQQDML